ncbi:MAG: phosphatase PAP2 family protein [Tannerellaceae bacterium]|nr:phosphatase PAP2 family protein [Tannerellaceae bacterium]
MKRQFLLILCLIAGTLSAQDYTRSSSQNAVKTSGDILFVAAPLTCLAVTVYKQDWQGLKQGALSGATSLGVSYALKFSTRKTRPDGSDKYSFPSAHAAVSFTGAAFLQRRYGWQWGAPAYLLAGYVAWSRTYADKHDWWDVIAGAAIGTGSAYIFTRPFAQKHNLAISPIATLHHMGFHLSMNF